MLKKLGLGILCASTLYSATALATINNNFMPGVSVDYELAPNDPQEFNNPWFWTITATCTISTPDESDDVFAEMLSKTGKINGHSVSKGDKLTVTVHNKDKLTITADPGSKVKLTNLGASKIKASCSA